MALTNDDKKLSTKGILVDDFVVGRSIGSAFYRRHRKVTEKIDRRLVSVSTLR